MAEDVSSVRLTLQQALMIGGVLLTIGGGLARFEYRMNTFEGVQRTQGETIGKLADTVSRQADIISRLQDDADRRGGRLRGPARPLR